MRSPELLEGVLKLVRREATAEFQNTFLVRPGLVPMSPARRGSRISDWLALARVSNLPTVVTNVVAGAAIGTSPEAGLPGLTVVVVAAACVLVYVAGMALNDVCDVRWDALHRPERPIPSGAIGRRAALVATAVALAAALALLTTTTTRAVQAGALLVVVVAVYDVWHRQSAWSALLMAATRSLVYVVAAFAVGNPDLPLLTGAGAVLATYVALLTLLARHGHGGWIARLIAGVSVIDGVVLALLGHLGLAAGCVLAVPLTLALQRRVVGT